MDFEQIMIRLGLDARAVTHGLARVGSFIKAWAHGIVHDLQSHVAGRFLGLYFVEKILHGALEKTLFIKRVVEQTGVSVNMIQSMIIRLGATGEDFEVLNRPLTRFSALVGQAKLGIPEARGSLLSWGAAVKDTNWTTFNATEAIINLSKAYDKLGSVEEKAAMLQGVFGKQFKAFQLIFEEGHKKVEDMTRGNFFTKLTPGSLDTIADTYAAVKWAGAGIIATVGNIYGHTVGIVERSILQMKDVIKKHKEVDAMSGKERFEYIKDSLRYQLFGATEEERQHKSLEAQKRLLSENLKLQEAQNEARRLGNQLSDRQKFTVDQLADRARKLTGNHLPRGLDSIYAITPAMATALRIQNLEDQAKIATARGNFGGADGLQSAADKLRGQNFALRSGERDPTLEIRERLDIINTTLLRANIPVTIVNEGH